MVRIGDCIHPKGNEHDSLLLIFLTGFVTIQIREAGNFSVEEIDEDEDTICVESFVTGRVLLLDGQVLDIFINIGGTATGTKTYTMHRDFLNIYIDILIFAFSL